MKIQNPTTTFFEDTIKIFKGKIIFSNDSKIDIQKKVFIGKFMCLNELALIIQFFKHSEEKEYIPIELDNKSITFGHHETIENLTNQPCAIFILNDEIKNIFNNPKNEQIFFKLSLYNGDKYLEDSDMHKLPLEINITEYMNENLKKGIIWSADKGFENENNLKNGECLIRLSHAPKAHNHIVLCSKINNTLEKSYLTPKVIVNFGIETFIYFLPFIKNIVIWNDHNKNISYIKTDVLNPFLLSIYDYDISAFICSYKTKDFPVVINDYCDLLEDLKSVTLFHLNKVMTGLIYHNQLNEHILDNQLLSLKTILE